MNVDKALMVYDEPCELGPYAQKIVDITRRKLEEMMVESKKGLRQWLSNRKKAGK